MAYEIASYKAGRRYAFFWSITHRRVVILYRRFGTTYRPHLRGTRSIFFFDLLTSEDVTNTFFPETSAKDYHSTLRNTPEERRSHQHRSGSLKSRMLDEDCWNSFVVWVRSHVANTCTWYYEDSCWTVGMTVKVRLNVEKLLCIRIALNKTCVFFGVRSTESFMRLFSWPQSIKQLHFIEPTTAHETLNFVVIVSSSSSFDTSTKVAVDANKTEMQKNTIMTFLWQLVLFLKTFKVFTNYEDPSSCKDAMSL